MRNLRRPNEAVANSDPHTHAPKVRARVISVAGPSVGGHSILSAARRWHCAVMSASSFGASREPQQLLRLRRLQLLGAWIAEVCSD